MHNGKPPVEGEYWWDERGNPHYWYRYEDGTIDEGGTIDAEMIDWMLADAPKYSQRVHVWSIEGPRHEEADISGGGQEAADDVRDGDL